MNNSDRGFIAVVLVLLIVAIGVVDWQVKTIGKRVAVLESQPATITGQQSGPWGQLRQAETDKITALLGPSLPRRDIVIYCQLDCAGLALDFDNAFESAKWGSRIETPAIDVNTGINVAGDGPDAELLRHVLNEATGDRFNIGLIPGDHLAVVISAKPKAAKPQQRRDLTLSPSETTTFPIGGAGGAGVPSTVPRYPIIVGEGGKGAVGQNGGGRGGDGGKAVVHGSGVAIGGQGGSAR